MTNRTLGPNPDSNEIEKLSQEEQDKEEEV